MIELKDRIRIARLEKGFQKKELAKRLEVSPSSITYYEKGTKNPSPETLQNLSKILEKPVSYFLNNTDSTIENGSYYESVNKNTKIINLKMIAHIKSSKNSLIMHYEYEIIPIFSNWLSYDVSDLTQSQIDEKFKCVKVIGDSMYPDYLPNDLLIVEKDTQIINGKKYIITIDNDISVKTIYKHNNQITLISPSNCKDYEPNILTPTDFSTHNISIEYRVIKLIRSE